MEEQHQNSTGKTAESSDQSLTFTKRFQEIYDKEKKILETKDDKEVRGFAISGGGIRSASFGLGVMQALVANRQLERMTYLSTVSGGGYIGSALTWALFSDSQAGTSPENFPFGKRGKSGSGHADSATGDEKDNGLLDYIRLHAKYLTPASKLDIISLVAVMARSILISLLVYFLVMMVIVAAISWNNLFLFNTQSFSNLIYDCTRISLPNGIFLPLAILLLALYLVMAVLYSLFTFFTHESGNVRDYLNFIKGQERNGILWKVIITLVLVGTLPMIHEKMERLCGSLLAASGSLSFGSLVGIWQYFKAQKNEKNSGSVSDVVIYFGAAALMYGLLLMAYHFVSVIFEDKIFSEYLLSLLLLTLLTLCVALITNLNLVGPHRIWRDRLMEVFMPGKDAVKKNEWQPAKEADAKRMDEMCRKKPYHIINTNIILGDSPKVKYRSRGGDNFIISPLYCGSEATGWTNTSEFQRQKESGRGITLATAMATSAAALNPNAGVSGEGFTRNKVVSLLLSTLNLRLGYWTTNPDPKKHRKLFPPNFLFPGITSELAENGFNEKREDVLLSDGGHFENLAIYELIRRKLKIIVLSDGGADPAFNFDDLANAVEKARVDFGAKIEFLKDFGLDRILPGTAGNSDFDKKYAIAQNGFAVARITYDNNEEGWLYYIKLAMIAGLPTDIYSYKGVNPDFPHQSTADQFFDEKQFEAYRELGYHIGWKMMESEPGKRHFIQSPFN